MPSLVRTARITGLLYLALALTGIPSFLIIRPRLYAEDDPAATLAHLLEHETLARVGVSLELALVVAQALVALWFYRLFRSADPFAAGAIAVFGLVNAMTILASGALLASAVSVAHGGVLGDVGSEALSVQLMYVMSGNLWAVGAVFFGLWLIPMGWLVLRTRWMPRPLGWLLLASGGGYVASAFVGFLAPSAEALAMGLTIPATVGEFWFLGYLLLFGVHPRAAELASEPRTEAPAPTR